MDIASLTIKVVNEGLDAAAKGLGDLGDKAKTAQDRVDGFNKNMSGLRNVALGVGGSILGAGAAIVKVSGNFEAAMNGVKAVSGAAGDEFDALREKAKELGATTAFSASEAANGMEFLAMAGMNTEQILSTIPNALNLAAAGGIELAQSADILSNVMTGMGLAAEESGRAADVLAKAAASANVDIGMIGESMKYVAPISKQLGISLEDTAAMVGVLGNAGIQGSEAGTALRAVYSRLATDNKAKAHFEALGIAIQDAEGNMRPMTSLLSELGKATEDMAAADALKIFKDAVGAEAMSAFGVSIDSIKDGSLQELINKLNEAEGSAKAMADTKMEGFEGAMKGLASAGEALMIAIGESGLLDIVTDLTTRFADFVRQLADTNPEIFKTIGIVAGVVLAFSGLVLAIAGIGSVIGTAISAFTGMIAVAKLLVVGIGLLVSPIGLVVLGIAGLIAIGVALYKNWDTIKAKASELKDGMAQAWGQAVSSTQENWESIKSTVGQKAEQAKQVAINAFNSLPSPIQNILTIVYNVVKTQLDLVRNIFSTVLNVIKAAVRGDMQGVVDAFKQGMSNAISIIKTGVGNILSAFSDLGAKLFKIGSDAIQGLINGLKSKVGNLKSTAKELASTALNTLKGLAGFDTHSPSKKTIAIGKDVGQGLANGIKKSTKVVKTESQKLAEQAVDSIKQAIKGLERDIALFGNDDPIAAMLWDRANTNKYKGVGNGLFNQAVDLTKQKQALELGKKFDEAIKSIEKTIKNSSVRTELQKWYESLRDGSNELSRLDLGKKIEVLEKAANLDYSNLSKEMAKSSLEIDRQVELLGVKSDLDKELMQIGYEANDLLEKYNFYLEQGQIARYNEIEAMVMGNAERKKGLAILKEQQRTSEAMNDMVGGLNEKSPLEKLQDEQDERLRIIQESMIAEGEMKQSHIDAMLAIDERYERDLQKLKLAQYGDGLSLFTQFMGAMLGENKRAKRIMFALEKGFALATVLIENKKALAKAWSSAPFPYNLGVVASTAMQTGALAAAVQAISPKGFKSGGYTGSIGANNIAGVVHGNEYVFDAQSTKAIGVENLERIRRGKNTGEVNITVNNHSSAKVETETDSQGNIIMTIRDEVKRSWSNLQKPNSHESKMLGRNFQAPRRR